MIHQYKLNGYNIVLDIYSGSVHCVDEVAYDMIAMYEQNDKQTIVDAMLAKYGAREDVTAEELAECYDDITALAEQGKHHVAKGDGKPLHELDHVHLVQDAELGAFDFNVSHI